MGAVVFAVGKAGVAEVTGVFGVEVGTRELVGVGRAVARPIVLAVVATDEDRAAGFEPAVFGADEATVDEVVDNVGAAVSVVGPACVDVQAPTSTVASSAPAAHPLCPDRTASP